MAVVTQSTQSQSSAALAGQSTSYIKGLVLMQVAGAPDTLVDAVLQQVLREFYTMSNGWRVTIGPYNIGANVPQVQFNPVNQYGAVVNVFGVYLYPNATGGNTPQWLYVDSDQMRGTDTGPPVRIWMQTPDTGLLYPNPDKNYGSILYAVVSLKPVINTTQLPPISTEQHLDGLVSGVLSKLYSMPEKPFTNERAAKDHERIFKRQILMARDLANRQYATIDARRRFPEFAGRGSQRLNRMF